MCFLAGLGGLLVEGLDVGLDEGLHELMKN
jgi:hypothetical protein